MRATYGAQVTADEPQYLLTALSLADDGDLDISDERAAEVWRDFHAAELPVQTLVLVGGARISPHDPLLPLLLAGPVAAGEAGPLGGWVAAKLTLAALAGALAALLAWVAVRRLGVPVAPAVLTVAAFCCAPPLSVYGTQVYPELPAAAAVTVALAALLGRPGPVAAVVAGAAMVALPWLAVKYVPVAAVLAAAGLWWLWRSSGRTAGFAWLGALASAGLVWVGLHLLVYGGLTAYATGDFFAEGGSFVATGPNADYPARSQRLLGLLVDRDFGLVPWAPGYLLLPVALGFAVAAGRAGAPRPVVDRSPWHGRAVAVLLLATLAAGWASATWLAQTMHGWWWPGRQLVVVLPAAVLLVACWAGAGWPRSESGRTRGQDARLEGAGDGDGRRAGTTGPSARWRTWLVGGLGVLGLGSHLALVIGTTVPPSGELQPRWHTLVVDFANSPWPIYQALRLVSPDFTAAGLGTATVAGSWLLALVALAWWGGRQHRSAATNGVEPTGAEPPPAPSDEPRGPDTPRRPSNNPRGNSMTL